MKFDLTPVPVENGFQQWRDTICIATRMPNGILPPIRQKLWISLASNYIREICLDWNKIQSFAFNNCTSSDDDELGIQIVKDLHRTGCSWSDNEGDRSTLKRVLLAFARYNKSIGYCQGLNILTAVILQVVDKNEEDALMVLIYLVEKILPNGFFTNNLQALAIDMAVFGEWLRIYNIELHNHLHELQMSSKDATGTIYEPPLLNVFTIQWFLTLFATCLPRRATLRVWDALLLEGSEILFRTGLVIWSKLATSVLKQHSADQFYSIMGLLSVQLLDEKIVDADSLIRDIYAFGPFPTTILQDLRQKFSLSITPFQQLTTSDNVTDRSSTKSQRKDGKTIMNTNGLSTKNHSTDEESTPNEEIANFMSCFSILASPSRNRSASAEQRNRSQMSTLHPNDPRRLGQTDDRSTVALSNVILSSSNISNNKNTSSLTKQHSTVYPITSGPLVNHLLLKVADPKRNMYKKKSSIKSPVSIAHNTRVNCIEDSPRQTLFNKPLVETS
ncbi:unnamed protein product, partial [Didymodactylos carnosus]